MATHSSVLAWRIPGTGEPGGLPDVYGVAQSRTRLKRLSSSMFPCKESVISSSEILLDNHRHGKHKEDYWWLWNAVAKGFGLWLFNNFEKCICFVLESSFLFWNNNIAEVANDKNSNCQGITCLQYLLKYINAHVHVYTFIHTGSQHGSSHPWQGHAGEPWQARRVRARGPPWICLSVYPKTKICLFYYFTTFTNFWHERGAIPDHLSLKKINLEL